MQITCNKWLDLWLTVYIKPTKKEKTYRCYKDAIRRIKNECPDFLDKNLDEINEIEIQAFINSLADKYAKSTINHIRVVFNRSFCAAVTNKYCSKSPISSLSIPKKASQKKVRALTYSEQLLVEKAAKADALGNIVLFFLDTGLREHELCSLKWTDYFIDETFISIRESKTDAGVRIVPLIPEAVDIIKSQPHINDFIFNSTRNTPVTESVLRKLYLRMRKATGINFITNHVYRHSFATRLMEKGASPKALSALLGHKDIAFTLRRYTNTEDSFLRKQISLLYKSA